MHGKFVDATPFEDSLKKAGGRQGSESSSLVDDLGSMLTAQGFDKFGTEVLYSGVYGTELTCEIFIGPVYYQRLRHMVSDKFQVCLLHFLSSFSPSLHVFFFSDKETEKYTTSSCLVAALLYFGSINFQMIATYIVWYMGSLFLSLHHMGTLSISIYLSPITWVS